MGQGGTAAIGSKAAEGQGERRSGERWVIVEAMRRAVVGREVKVEVEVVRTVAGGAGRG